jgi:CheY-like chemotaxis protein
MEEMTMSNAAKRQILVVDDNQAIRETFALLLMSAGYDVVVAEDGFAALSQLRKLLPDVIVSDLEMPRMSGFELLSVVRRRFPHILTVAMSGAYSDDGLPVGVIADGFYAKGRQPANLVRMLEDLIASAPPRGIGHGRDTVPAWIPRNGNDSHGIPYVMLICEECLRIFQLAVVEETTGQVLEVPCRFCPSMNKYIIQPSGQDVRALCA